LAFSVFSAISLIGIIVFVVTKKNLHLFEILFIWMAAMILDHNFMTIVSLNLGMYHFANRPTGYWSLSLVRIILVPLLIVWFFDKTSTRPYNRWIFLPVGVAALIGIEYLCDVMHVFQHTRWQLWWSMLEWVGVFLVIHFAWLWYHHLLQREME
jgi:hypothetical protein